MRKFTLAKNLIIFTILISFASEAFASSNKIYLLRSPEQLTDSTPPVKDTKLKHEKIKIIGSERVDQQTIRSYLDIKQLETGNQKSINSSLKQLYESSLFSEVNIFQEGSTVVIKVKENPIISDIKFEGNKKIDDDTLASEILLKKRSIYTKSKLQSDIKRINDIYIKSGRFLTKIDPKIISKDQNRVELLFKIFEGKKAKIGDIYIIGNDVFPDQDLLDEITTKKSRWYKPFSSSDSYDSDRVEFDKERLRRFYTARGFADFSTISAIAQITPNKSEFFITFLLEEGIKYDFGKTKIINHVKKFDEKLLKKAILIKKGKVYNSELVEKTVDKMIEIMSENGYAFANIDPILKRDKDKKIIDVDFEIRQTPRIYINQINISGNNRTLDKVIRRELRVREGDAYNVTKINRSRQRIVNLGFFDKVELTPKRVGNTDKVDLEVSVKEKKTGELNFGVGYSTVDKMTGNVGIRERNLLGTGQDLSANVQKSSLQSSGEISYTRPYFMNREIAVGADLFNYTRSKRDNLVYATQTSGFTVRGNYAISEHVNHQIRYSYKDEVVKDVDATADIFTKNLEGSYQSSSIGHTFSIENRDNRFDPREGYYASLSEDYAAFNGNLKYLKHEGSAGYYIPIITKDFVFKISGTFGHIDGIGQDINPQNYFYLGGNNFRGFQWGGIGPRSADASGNAKNGRTIGGKLYYVGTTEFRFPLGLPKEIGINSSLFYDVGTLKMVDKSVIDGMKAGGLGVVDSGSLRSSYGLSIVWTSPLGPIRLDFSKTGKAEEYDNTENFRFSFGTTF